MESNSTNEAAIFEKLQSSVVTDIYQDFTAHLQPFTLFFPDPSTTTTTTTTAVKPLDFGFAIKKYDRPSIYSLGVNFSSFLKKSIRIIRNRLGESSQITQDSATELFRIYRFCLDCCDLIEPYLGQETHLILKYKNQYIGCLTSWHRFREAEDEGYTVLGKLNKSMGSKPSRPENAFVPQYPGKRVGGELGKIVLDIVQSLVLCSSKRSTKTEADCRRLTSLITESKPWFRILDDIKRDNLHCHLRRNLGMVTLFLVGEIKNFSVDFICEFSKFALKEYKESYYGGLCEFALEVCSSMLSQKDEPSILIVLECVLNFTAAECKRGLRNMTWGFLELVSGIANKCQSEAVGLCHQVATILKKSALSFSKGFPFISSILMLYVSGLFASSSNNSKEDDAEKFTNPRSGSLFQVFFNDREQLREVAVNFDTSYKKGHQYPRYWEAIKFFCLSCARSIHSNGTICSELESASCWEGLSSIHDVLRQFCRIFLHSLSHEERGRETSQDEHSVISVVVVAALLLSFQTNQNPKESMLLVESVISTPWIPVKRLQYLSGALYNMADEKQLKEDVEHAVMLDSLLPSSIEIFKREHKKLLEEELPAYHEQSHQNPSYCHEMKMKVINVLLKEIYVQEESMLEECKSLISKGKLLRISGFAQLNECIQCLSDAILTLKLLYDPRSCSSRFHHHLVHAYLLRALSKQEATLYSTVCSSKSDFLPDIHEALNLLDHGNIDEQYEDMLYLLYQLMDFLSIKGSLEVHPRFYDVVIKLFEKKNFSLTKTLAELWRSKRLSHALCASPVNDMVVETFSKHQTEFRRMCMEELKPLVVGFHRTNNEIKQAVSDIPNVQTTNCSIFLSSNLYYDLSERLISSGQMIEALQYAQEAHGLRSRLLGKQFNCSLERMAETFVENGSTINRVYSATTLIINDSMEAKRSSDYEGPVLTPWNVLSCYLESVFQVGFLQEILGNVSEAEGLFRGGRHVAKLQGLPLFEISFSCALGKICRKLKFWSMAKKELDSANRTLHENLGTISCKKCLCMLGASINQQLGDLFCMSSTTTRGGRDLSSATILYKSALDKLILFDWRTPYSTSEDSLSNDNSEFEIERSSKRTKKEVQPASQRQDIVYGPNRKITRSVHHSLGETRYIEPADKQTDYSFGLGTEHTSTAAVRTDRTVILQSDIRALCNNFKCWHCLYIEAVGCSNLKNYMCINWELVRRKLCLRLCLSIGKFSGHDHEACEILSQSIFVLFGRSSDCSKYSSDALVLVDSIGEHFPGDALAVERAALLYYICWFSVKHKDTRDSCCKLSSIGTEKIVSLLKLSFILSRDVPLLFQKISRLLATMYVLSTSTPLKQFSLSRNEEGSESLWASFFHQASIGTQFNSQIDRVQKKKRQIPKDSEDSSHQTSVPSLVVSLSSLRPAPESCKDLEQFVRHFFRSLPSTPVICISFVTGADASLLMELLPGSPKARAWIMLSRLSSDNQRVILLPAHEILEGVSSIPVISECKDFVKQWDCPWFSSVIDVIAPVFRHIIEGNYYAGSKYYFKKYGGNKLFWEPRRILDESLGKFLQAMEDMWLGTWKYLLVGKWPDCNNIESTQMSLSQNEHHLLQHLVTKKCYVGGMTSEDILQLLFKPMLKASDNGEPIILVLDIEVQMLPWENLPILTNEEVYRMPSIISIFATVDRYCQNHQEQGETSTVFPLIDPLDSYYVLNPGGDLHHIQTLFEGWFKDKDLKGKSGTPPTIEELTPALKNQDLFIYCGHGSGMQYIPELKFEELDGCAAAVIIGCSSGSLYLNGCYRPQGAPLSYLLAGSPLIVANMWQVNEGDVGKFAKAMLGEWFEVRERKRSAASCKCAQCIAVHRKSTTCSHRPRIGSLMRKGRDACLFRFLTGASAVCYGVPTGITC